MKIVLLLIPAFIAVGMLPMFVTACVFLAGSMMWTVGTIEQERQQEFSRFPTATPPLVPIGTLVVLGSVIVLWVQIIVPALLEINRCAAAGGYSSACW